MDRLCGVTLCVFLSIEEVSIPKLEKIFRVPKIFEVSNFKFGFLKLKIIFKFATASAMKARSKFKRVELLFFFLVRASDGWLSRLTGRYGRKK